MCLFLVEAIAQKSQNIIWNPTVDGRKISHKRIRRVSLDQFYALVTGEKDAFYQMCMVLPEVIESVVVKGGDVKVPHDTVAEELKKSLKYLEKNLKTLLWRLLYICLDLVHIMDFRD